MCTGQDVEARITYFMDEIEAEADNIHSVILNGDVLELWYFEIDEVPPTLEQAKAKWTNPKTYPPGLDVLKRRISVLTDKHGIKVYN